ncbi:MAG TPA: GAF and ANTAR domain-containing protein [Jatrophihabitans sp.]|nr:GAF and ANTAR domain-containing protein [Jatrophihabitans sp.]
MSELPASDSGFTQLELLATFTTIARALAGRDEESSLVSIVQHGIAMIGGAHAAGITTLTGGRFTTRAPSAQLVNRVDAIQYELKSGPCIDALVSQVAYRTGNLAHDQRWPEFGRRAAQQDGVLSMLAFRLFLDVDDSVAALNFYSRRRDAFDYSAELLGGLFATHAAIALRTARLTAQVSNLEHALTTNRDIGTAIGVLMATHKITRQQAFDLLRIASQHSHRKLREIALDVVETGVLDYPATPVGPPLTGPR